MDNYTYAWYSEKIAQEFSVKRIPLYSYKTIEGIWVKMTYRSTHSTIAEKPKYERDGKLDYTNPDELQFMGILEMPLMKQL